eukprot:Phypoly_transcript_01575.p1 GENE.Phypoly_transcript_01575~~Phypoly_transcript_01575.p1  ORF type:complete len:894 (+),score=113.77 Phypoly_transcript_01575:551-3232(+)
MLASLPSGSSLELAGSNWWLGEKYDGIRSCWHPKKKKLYSRFGRVIPMTSSVLRNFPRIFLDGECWFGRGLYLLSFTLVRSDSESVRWENLRNVVFDNQAANMQLKPFEKRYKRLLFHIPQDHPCAIVATRLAVENHLDLEDIVKCIIEEGGEGVILRKIGSIYEHGRTSALLKIKTYDAEKEGIVTGVGSNKFVRVYMPDGRYISVPQQNVEIPFPEIGSVVTIAYERNSRRDTIVNPKITRLRSDLQWEDVLQSSEKEKKVEGFRTKSRKLLSKPASGPFQSYTKVEERRTFFYEYAIENEFDPLVADHWYTQPKEFVLAKKGSSSVLQHHNNSVTQALVDLFPDVHFDTSKLWSTDVWDSALVRRKFFVLFAKTQEGDPLDPQFWYTTPIANIMTFQGISHVLKRHQNSLCGALQELFPEIGIEEPKFTFRVPWREESKRREFFESFAENNGFDASCANHWYMQSKPKFLSEQDIFGVISYHNNSIAQAIVELFPFIGLEKSQFWSKGIWYQKSNRRRYFEHFAKANGFDPEDKDSWYLHVKEGTMDPEEIAKVIWYHRNSVTQALVDLFPNIGLEKSQFTQIAWQETSKRREFFLMYAAQYGIDANKLEEWTSHPLVNLMSFKGVETVLSFHSGSVAQALKDLFPNVVRQNTDLWDDFFWSEIKNRKSFLINYANENAFDPLNAEMWNSHHLLSIRLSKDANKMLSYHKNNVVQAVIDLFPELETRKSTLWHEYFSHLANRRCIFEEYASREGFDPLNPNNWYDQQKFRMIAQKDIATVLEFYENDLYDALTDLFPEIRLDRTKMRAKPDWHNEENRKQFFVKYAAENNFDPLIPNNWYTHPRASILATKGASRVIHYHNDSVVQSLVELFPETAFERSKFSAQFYNPH